MILVDTGVWSHHFRAGNQQLATLLGNGQVVTHAWIVGELALGPGMRLDIINDLKRLPILDTVSDSDGMDFIELHQLRGIGWVDVNLLLAALRSKSRLWTTDKKLQVVAERFQMSLTPS